MRMKSFINKLKSSDMATIYLLALATHIVLLVFFFALNVPVLAWFNVGSVILYFFLVPTTTRFDNKKLRYVVFMLSTIEVTIHQILGVIYVGTDAGFLFYLVMEGVIVMLQPKTTVKTSEKVITCTFLSVMMILLELHASQRPPYYEIPTETLSILFVIIVSTAAFGIFGSAYRLWNISEHYRDELEQLLNEQTSKIMDMQEKVILNFADIIESRDGNTGGHIKRTSAYVSAIIDGLCEDKKYTDILTPEYIRMVISAAPLHDIGKISISDTILCKKGKLTTEEYDVMKTHSSIGGSMLGKLLGSLESEDYVRLAAAISRYHHERWDGAGYPEGLSGTDIPLSARIMAVADVFDALTSVRVYKEKISCDEAYVIMESEAGKQFDPVIIEEFIRIKPIICEITERLAE